jgi:hypothetical protein
MLTGHAKLIPTHAHAFTYAWVCVTTGIVALGLPRFLSAAGSRHLFAGARGVREDRTGDAEKPAPAPCRPRTAETTLNGPRGPLSAVGSALRWILPLIELDVG